MKKILLEKLVSDTFTEGDPRIDYYIDKIRESYKSSNKLVLANDLFIFLFIISFHLYCNGYIQQFAILGQTIANSPIVKKWGLIIPSIVYMTNSSIKYLRVCQYNTIEYLFEKYRKKEFISGLYRLTLPSDYTLAINILLHSEKTSFLLLYQ